MLTDDSNGYSLDCESAKRSAGRELTEQNSFLTEYSKPRADCGTIHLPSARRIDPIEIYASIIDTSDYVERVAAVIGSNIPATGDLLDVGAGGGQLGRILRDPGRQWTAIEPNPKMRARLAGLRPSPRIVPSGWELAEIVPRGHDTVLAASIAAPLTVPCAFLSQCHVWASKAIVWIVPAHRGPRGLIFAGCLPTEWHGEDETPGLDIVLGALPRDQHPHSVNIIEWTYAGVFADLADLANLANYLGQRLGWTDTEPRRKQILPHLLGQARMHSAGFRLVIPRKSAVLVWRLGEIPGMPPAHAN